MPKLRLTKNELKKQKDALKRFRQYLPTLLLKKQQLQAEMLKLHAEKEHLKQEKAFLKAKTYKWVDVFAEKSDIKEILHLDKVVTESGNIAGIEIPVFVRAEFIEKEYDLFVTPLWVDHGIEALKKAMTLIARTEGLEQQDRMVREELRVTTQRVNLFEKVMIPDARDKIRKIQIYLGDMQTAAVVTGKIAKDKIVKSAVARAAV